MTVRKNSYKYDSIRIDAPVREEYAQILSPEAVQFLGRLEQAFGERRRELLARRAARQAALDAGEKPVFLAETASVRRDPSWRVAETPPDLQQRWVEITGPTERKMLINALNSGADTFMADFEDANSPTWANMIEGQANLYDAVRRQISFTNPDGKSYTLNDQTAVLLVRPRGWHLEERHFLVDDRPVSASLFDFGLYFFHNARQLIENGTGPYFYLPKLESHLEARLWSDVFIMAQEEMGIPLGTVRATVLIETILAAFEMEEILYELREHSAGLNAGRWDYIFSLIKFFRRHSEVILPDRVQITMTTPFMRSYTELLVQTCHKRGAHAIGGMAAFIPSRRDAQVNQMALTKVTEDKQREAGDGFDGTWVAHPDLVSTARQVFAAHLGSKKHQKERLREEVQVTEADLLTFHVPGGQITEKGLRLNMNVGLQYIEAWLRGSGAVAIYNLMEDTATAEISRAQVWQWLHNRQASLSDGRPITLELYRRLLPEELQKIRSLIGEEAYQAGKFAQAARLFDRLVTQDEFIEFLTLAAYAELEG